MKNIKKHDQNAVEGIAKTEQKWPDSINKEMSPGTDKCRIFGICLHSRKPETKPGQSKSYEWSRTPESKEALR